MGCCEQVLEILTEGTVSPREHQMLAEHLCDCPSCRRLADALSPAVELFRDVLREDAEEAEFAAAWGSDEELSLGEGSGERLLAGREHLAGPWDAPQVAPEGATRRAWNGRSWLGLMGLAATLLVGIMLGGTITSSTNRLAHAPGPGVGPGGSRAMLESLGLASACWQPPAGVLLISSGPLVPPAVESPLERQPARHARPAELADVSCCTFCHAADKPLQPAAGKNAAQAKPLDAHALNARLQTSCQLCHGGPSAVSPFTTARVQ